MLRGAGRSRLSYIYKISPRLHFCLANSYSLMEELVSMINNDEVPLTGRVLDRKDISAVEYKMLIINPSSKSSHYLYICM